MGLEFVNEENNDSSQGGGPGGDAIPQIVKESQETALTTVDVDNIINQEVKKFNLADAKIAEIKAKADALKIEGVSDSKTYKDVDDLRKEVKRLRINVGKQKDVSNEVALRWQRSINAEAKRLTEALTPIETALQAKTDAIDKEKERIKKEKEEAEAKRLKERMAKIFAAGMTFNGELYSFDEHKITQAEVENSPDPEFNTFIQKVEIAYSVHLETVQAEKEKKEKAEKERIEREQKEEQEKALAQQQKEEELKKKEQELLALQEQLKQQQLELQKQQEKQQQQQSNQVEDKTEVVEVVPENKVEEQHDAVIETEHLVKKEPFIGGGASFGGGGSAYIPKVENKKSLVDLIFEKMELQRDKKYLTSQSSQTIMAAYSSFSQAQKDAVNLTLRNICGTNFDELVHELIEVNE